MGTKKAISTFFLLFAFCTFLFPQSLVELSQQEKERREKLKGKKAPVVTNTDLARVKKRPAVEMAEQFIFEEMIPEAREEEAVAVEEAQPVPQEETAPPEEKIDLAALEENLRRANEYVSLYSLKMNGLWQEFYSLDDMISRDAIQQEISETYLALQKAEEDVKKFQEELDKARALLQKKKLF